MVSTKLVLVHQYNYSQNRSNSTAMTNLRQQKKQCRKAYRTALKSGQDSEVIKQLSSQWCHLIRQHNQTRLKTLRRSGKQKARNQQIRCDKDFWKFVASVFYDNSSSDPDSFPTVHDTELHFTKCFRQSQFSFMILPSYLNLHVQSMHLMIVTFPFMMFNNPSENRCRQHHILWIRFPRLSSKSAHLFMLHCCLYFKNAEDPRNLANYKPIALTSCVSKLFTSFVKRRLESSMIGNVYINCDLQKALIPGCHEHQFKVWRALQDAKASQRSLCAVWLDLKNAYALSTI